MSDELWHRLDARLREHSYMYGVERTVERVQATAEVFTPTSLVIEILRYLDIELFAPGKTVLDPACGDGQFLAAAKWLKVENFGMSERDALADLYGVDLMRDNVDLCRRRLQGGTILMGDSLHPTRRIQGQTAEEYLAMSRLFSEASTRRPRKTRVARIHESRLAQVPEPVPLF